MLTAYAAETAKVAEATSSEVGQLFSWIIGKLPFVFMGGAIIVVSFVLARIVKAIVENKLEEKGIEEEHKEVKVLSGRIAYTGILTIGITSGLKIAGIDLTAIIAAGAFGIGFALKDLMMNFIAGIMILVGRQFSIGDFINVEGTLGRIEEIQSRVTILKAINGTKVVVPNANLFKNQVTSYTSNPLRRFDLKFSVDFKNDLTNVMKICLSVAKNTEGVVSRPKPSVVITGFGDNGSELSIRAWCETHSGWMKVKSKLAEKLKNEFNKYGISLTMQMYVNYDAGSYGINEKAYNEMEQLAQTDALSTNLPAAPVQELVQMASAPIMPAPLQPEAIPVPIDAGTEGDSIA